MLAERLFGPLRLVWPRDTYPSDEKQVSGMTGTIIVAIIGLIGVALGSWANVRVRSVGDRADRKLEALRSSLQEQREERGEVRSQRAVAAATVARYREPLVGAAFDLQTRIYNISTLRFFADGVSDYHIDHTMYVFAQYLGWREIVRRDVQFLDLGDVPQTKSLGELLEGVTRALSRTSPELSSAFKLFRGEQRAIGEKMIAPGTPESGATPGHTCLGYAAFVESLSDSAFAAWLDKLKNYVQDLELTPAPALARLGLLQNALIDLIDELDCEYVRFPEHLRQRITVSSAAKHLLSGYTRPT